jgi:hypothetical protein
MAAKAFVPLLLFLLPPPCLSLAFCPADRRDQMWDTWIFVRPSGDIVLNYLVKHNSSDMKVILGQWNGIGAALSSDGAHFADLGVVISKDCASKDDCAHWLGSGSVWPRILANASATNEDGDADDDFIMNYSQNDYDCEGGSDCQTIYFATSRDALSWTPVAQDAQVKGGLRFKYDPKFYKVGGRWDCIAVLRKPGGGYYGYWTATPQPSAALCGNTTSCGSGFGESEDGLHWTALPTPGPPVYAELGGVAQLGEKVFMVFNAGQLFEAPSPTGPFVASAANHDFLGQQGNSWFPRLWGETYTTDPSLLLVTHHQWAGDVLYAGLVKQAVLRDNVLRAEWWPANDALRGSALEVTSFTSNASVLNATSCLGLQCMTSGVWLEGTFSASARPAGIWLQTTTGGFGIGIGSPSPEGISPFLLGARQLPTSGWDSAHGPLIIDRHLSLGDAPSTFRVLARNAWSAQGMIECYVNGVLTLPFTVSGLTGVFSAWNGTVTAAARLTLPTQQLESSRGGH